MLGYVDSESFVVKRIGVNFDGTQRVFPSTDYTVIAFDFWSFQ